MTLFDRDQLTKALAQLIAVLQANETLAQIRIVGGAAISLRHFERDLTTDIDSRFIGSSDDITRAVTEIAVRNGWPDDWLNSSASQYIPDYGIAAEWETLYSEGQVVIEVASAETVLAMKLNVNRPGRDDADIATLLAIVGLTDLESIDEFFASFYPGDSLSDRAVRMIEKILSVGLPPAPPRMLPVVIDPGAHTVQ